MQELVIGGIYKHFKGHVYKVLCVGRNADTTEEEVVYQNVNDENDIWIRDKKEFLSLMDKEKYPDVEQEFRFMLISNEKSNH